MLIRSLYKYYLLIVLLIEFSSVSCIANLQVIIEPQRVCDSGAKWRVDGCTWHTGGYIETGISAGEHVIEYLSVEGWKTPVNQSVQINNKQTTVVIGQYYSSVDIDMDHRVDLGDYSSLSMHWGRSHCVGLSGCDHADIDGSGIVDIEDLYLICADWLSYSYENPTGMVYISAGTFQMGDSLYEGSSDELPVHIVTYNPFYINQYEITNSQYCLYLNSALQLGLIQVVDDKVYQASDGLNYLYCNTSSSFNQIHFNNNRFTISTKSSRDMSNDPVVMVTWYGAAAYCNWRSQKENRELCYDLSTWECNFSKKGYRLPTEAEWECAARGGLSGMRFPWGATISHDSANYYSSNYIYDVSLDRSYDPIWSADHIVPYTSPGGSYSANNIGIFDIAGNVREWCNDWYDRNYYIASPTNNPVGPAQGSNRVFRGGGWQNHGEKCRIACREFTGPSACGESLGFRLVLACN